MTSSPMHSHSQPSPVHALFEGLGYELDPVRVDIEEWKRAGFDLSLDGDDALVHLGRIDEVEILSLTSRDPMAARRVLESYRSFNRILRPLIALERGRDQIELWGWAERGRIGRLEVSRSERPQEVSRRLDLISSRPCHDLGARVEVALSRESISDRFFRRFSSAVDSIVEELSEHSVLREEAREWAVLFLSRLLFLFFIQEKEWLDGDRGFLVSRPLSVPRHRTLYRSFFEPLFFDCLNARPSKRNAAARRLGRVPYLNGGLFRRSQFEESRRDIELSDDLLNDVIQEVFARFPFTIREDDDSVVAIDPEMLGHVFESLMEQSERSRSGSFYTPKPVVDHLVGRAINVWRDGCQIELDVCSAPERREEILQCLRNVTVLDPACGSGAFLLAALGQIERLRVACGDTTAPATLRQQIVERSLFGIDLKREAVQLCELRLWLAIVAARPAGLEAVASIQPLPNLDRNIMQGNALLDPLALQTGQRLSVYRSWRRAVRERAELTEAYRHSIGERRQALYRRLRRSDLSLGEQLLEQAIASERDELDRLDSQAELFRIDERARSGAAVRGRIEELERELKRVRRGEIGFFSYDLHFSAVMERGGFDVVVGNPPWVRGANLEPTLRRTLRERYQWLRPPANLNVGFPQFELSVLFLEKAASITQSRGAVSMLVPGKILKAFYAARCRLELARRHTVCAIDDWSRESDMFDADTFPVGLTFSPEAGENPRIEIVRDGENWTTSARNLSIRSDAGEWSILPERLIETLREIWQKHEPLSSVLSRSPVMGVKTGSNSMFFLDPLSIDRHGGMTRSGVRLPWSALTRCIRGRDVRRWKATDSTWMLWPQEPGLPQWKQEFAAAHDIRPDELRLAYVRPEHLGWKVVWKDVATRIEAVVVPDSIEISGHRVPLLPNQTLYCLDAGSIDESYLHAAILNSSLLSVMAVAVAEPAKDDHYRFFARTIAQLPWPVVEPARDCGRRLIRLSRAAHSGADVQDEIDQLVCELYGVERELFASLAKWL
ncbi:MAG: N-6 DNA methylase [Acidobacteria bacterium]|nr:N-6 DNA methylase [Acidobacteriota bacterium]